jgi:hypothetical protein
MEDAWVDRATPNNQGTRADSGVLDGHGDTHFSWKVHGTITLIRLTSAYSMPSTAPRTIHSEISLRLLHSVTGKPLSPEAARVQQVVGTEPHAGDYWMTATVGEVFLLRQNYTDAARLYKAAVAAARTEKASHESTWKQACRLMDKLSPSAEERSLIRAAFPHLPDCL